MLVKPLVNIDDVVLDRVHDDGFFTARCGQISDHIGARKLGYNLTVVPPGKSQCPFHSHHNEEEMFLILDGTGELRFGDQRYPIRALDVIACPTGGAEVAHQIINTGDTDLRYLALSTNADVEICEYPDSGKIGAFAGPRGQTQVRQLHRTEDAVDYFDREDT